MPGHLNEHQLKGYRDRTLPEVELLAVDTHLGGCDPCRVVNVPGQKFWHTHVCPCCRSSWHHIAPTPMTQARRFLGSETPSTRSPAPTQFAMSAPSVWALGAN